MNPRKVLLAGWDAADWKVIRPLMDAGKMPNVRRLIENGCAGQIATLHPPLSPMLWTSIATGKRPFKHGIHGFSEPTPDGRGVRPVTNLSRKAKALWNILNQNALRSVVIGWWPSHPVEPINGVMISDHFHRANRPFDDGWPVPAHAIHPPELAQTLADLRVHPDQLTPDMVEPFIPLAKKIDQDQDKRLGMFLRTLAECMSIHSASIWLLDHQPWDFFAVYLDAIDHFCHGFMRYHPPRQSWIAERDFELYHNVISMAYQLHDRMLGALVEKAGEDVTVILMSDHGFHPDHLRPASIPNIPAGPAIEHRDFGVFAMSGPGIKKNDVPYSASVLDVAPTILSLYGLPVGEDMDGKVLSQVFVETPEVAFIRSWEEVAGADGCHPPYLRLDPLGVHEALEQMIALGYIERPDENRQIAVEKTVRELQYNLSEAYQDVDRHLEAREILRGLHEADPDEQRFAVRLFVSCQALGLKEEMRCIVDGLDGRRRALFEEAKAKIEEPESLGEEERRELVRWRHLARFQPVVVDYLKAQLLIAEKRPQEALAVLEGIPESGLLLQTGDLYFGLRRGRDAQDVYERALTLDPDNVRAYLGVCRLALRRRKFPVAALAALDVLQRVDHDPLAHYLLGVALAGMKEYARAAETFRAAISFNPHFPEAHLRLATLLEKHVGDPEAAREHRRLARCMRSGIRTARRRVTEIPACATGAVRSDPSADPSVDMEIPPLEESLIVVTGLPRSGTSMLMQMLAAGGMGVLSDALREADEDNPRGYLEFEPVKKLLESSEWLFAGRGKVIKIVAPLLTALPTGLACRVILCERDLDEVLDSQERMLSRHGQLHATTAERRRLLKAEYSRTLDRVKALLSERPATQLLVINYEEVVSNPPIAGRKISNFLDGKPDVAKIAAAVDAALHRNRAGVSSSD
jgi:predicted AlkP superfamily phosphohydrolase/phosphomutase/tetratricopeptide (TPR) repeat protein